MTTVYGYFGVIITAKKLYKKLHGRNFQGTYDELYDFSHSSSEYNNGLEWYPLPHDYPLDSGAIVSDDVNLMFGVCYQKIDIRGGHSDVEPKEIVMTPRQAKEKFVKSTKEIKLKKYNKVFATVPNDCRCCT